MCHSRQSAGRWPRGKSVSVRRTVCLPEFLLGPLGARICPSGLLVHRIPNSLPFEAARDADACPVSRRQELPTYPRDGAPGQGPICNHRHSAGQSLRCSGVREMGSESEPHCRSKPRNLRETTEDGCGHQLQSSKRGVGDFSLELSCSASSQSFDVLVWAGGLRVPLRTRKELASGLPGPSEAQSGLASVSTGRHASGVLECGAPLDHARLSSRSHEETVEQTPGKVYLRTKGPETQERLWIFSFSIWRRCRIRRAQGKLGHGDTGL